MINHSTRRQNIKALCEERGINELMHFTKVADLPSILEFGLIPREELLKRELRDQETFDDKDRYDHCPNANCLTISHPNYKMFFPKWNGKECEWVIIRLNSSILWELDCAFCQTNAASASVTSIDIETRKTFEQFQKMFENFQAVRRIELGLDQKYPTNPQAEVLVFENISPCYFLQIDFYSQNCLDQFQQKFNLNNSLFVANRNMYRPRHDYESWQ